MATFFGLCVWLTPLFLFLSLSANDNTLPTAGELPRLPLPNSAHTQSNPRLPRRRQLPLCRLLPELSAAPTTCALITLPSDVWLHSRAAPRIVPQRRGSHRPAFAGYPPTVALARPQLPPAHPDTSYVPRRCAGAHQREPAIRLFTEPPSPTEDGVRLHRTLPGRPEKRVRYIDFYFISVGSRLVPLSFDYCTHFEQYGILIRGRSPLWGSGGKEGACLAAALRSGRSLPMIHDVSLRDAVAEASQPSTRAGDVKKLAMIITLMMITPQNVWPRERVPKLVSSIALST